MTDLYDFSMFHIFTTAIDMFKPIRHLSIISLVALSAAQLGCDSTSDDTESVATGAWTINAEQFAAGTHSLSMSSNYGPAIELIPQAGGTTGIMRVAGVSTPVTFVYTPIVDGEEAELPRSATLDVTFVEPEADSMIAVLGALGVTLVENEAGEAEVIPAGASVTFNYSFTPFASVPEVVFARPSTEFNDVHANWTSFDGVATQGQTLGAWMLVDMLQGRFSVVTATP